MRNPRNITKPLAIGAPKPLLEIPMRPSRMIHFFDPSNPRMASKVPEIAKKVDVLLANLEDAIETKNKIAAREGLVKIAQATDFGATQFWSRVNSLDSPVVPRRHAHDRRRSRIQARRDHDPEGRGALGHPFRRPIIGAARGEARPEAPDPDSRDSRDRARRRERRGDRRRLAAHAGHEPRACGSRGLAAHEDDARRRRPPRLPRTRGSEPERRRTRRARRRSRISGTTRWRAWSTPASRPASCPSTARSATSSDPVGCEDQFRNAFLMGCVGAWSLHPAQIEIARRVFSPPPDEVHWARRVIEAMGDGSGTVMLEGKMQDDATVKQCRVMVGAREADRDARRRHGGPVRLHEERSRRVNARWV